MEQTFNDANTCILFSITHWQSSISWMVKDFVRLSEERFLMYTFVRTTVDGVNIKLKAMIKNQEQELKYSFTLGLPFYK